MTALEATLVDGRVDVLISAEHSGVVEVEGGIKLSGTFGFLARREGKVEFAKLCGQRLSWQQFDLKCDTPVYTGQVESWDTSNPADEKVTLRCDKPLPANLVGRTIVFANEGKQDAAYTIARVEPKGNTAVVSVGSTTLIRGFVDPADYSKGCTHNIAKGDRFSLPTSVYVEG